MKNSNGSGRKNSALLLRGKKVYAGLQSRLESRFKGKIVAIEVDSKSYTIGNDELDAAKKAQKKFPRKKLAFFRIGYPVVHKLRTTK